jgi:uncharacterized membrane protein YfcA
MDISPVQVVILFAAGVAGGIVSVLVSLASLVTYPALLAVGLTPLAANVTNTVALTFTGVGATLGARPELTGQRPTLLRLAIAVGAGGATGAALLLLLPGRTFELVAPPLIAGASVLILLQPRFAARPIFRPRGITTSRLFALYAVAIYAGYFGPAGGVLALVVLVTIIDRPFIQVNAAKAVLAGVANGVAAVAFIVFGPVRWTFVVPLAVGLFIGGLVGPWIARRVPARVLRLVIGVCGIGLAGVLAARAYGWA